MKGIKIFFILALALAIAHATFGAAPLPQFAYRDVNLHFASADGKPVAGAAIYGYCRDLNLMWPRRDNEVSGRNDIIWQESFLGKTGNDGSAKATIPPGNWRFFAAGTTGDGAVVMGWTDPHSPAPGETIQIAPTATKHWSFASTEQLPLSPKRLFIRPQQFPVWIPIRLSHPTDAPLQFELSAGPVDVWIADDASSANHPGYALAMPTVSSQTPDGKIAAAAKGTATIVFKGGKGQSVLTWECPFQPGLEDDITLCDGARVVVSAGDYFLSYRRPIGNGLTATFIGQEYRLQPSQAGSLDLDSPLTAGVDQNMDPGKKGHPQFYGQLYLADANGHMLGNLLDASHHIVPVTATVTVNGVRYPMRPYHEDKGDSADTGEEGEDDNTEGLAASPYAPKWEMIFVAGKDFPSVASDVAATWEFTAPPGILPQTTFVREAPVAVSSTCFSTNVPRVVQRQATNLLMQADGMARTMEQVGGHGRSKFSVTQLIIEPKGAGASSTLTGLRTTIPPRIFYSNHPMYAHTIVHETGHNFGYNHGGLMESVVEVVRCGGTAADQISQQPIKWLFLDRMNGKQTIAERAHYQNVGLFLYFYTKGGANFLHFLSAHEKDVMSTLTKQNYQIDDVIAALLTVATGSDSAPICASYGLTLNPQFAGTVLQQVQQMCSTGETKPQTETRNPSRRPERARKNPARP